MSTTPKMATPNDEILERFMAITHSTPDDAAFYLRFARGNLHQACQNFFADDSSDGETSNVLPPPPPRHSSPQLSGFVAPPPPPPPRLPSPQLSGSMAPPPHPRRLPSPQRSGLTSPPLPHRKHPGDSDHEHGREGPSAKRVYAPTRSLPGVHIQSALAETHIPAALPEMHNPAALPEVRTPSALPEVRTPSALPEARTPSALPEVRTPSALPEVHARSRTVTGAAAAADTVVEPVKGPTYDSDLALAKNLQREYDADAADYRLGWGSNHPAVTKPKGAFPDHWIRNPNWAGLGPHFNTSLGGVNRSLGAIPSDPFPQKTTRCLAPEEILSPLTWEQAMEVGVKEERWMLINIQDPTILKCQVLNRDIWNDPKIIDMVREKFIFLQCRREEYRAREYISFHFSVSHLDGNVYPHIAILDPRTGEQLKLWTGYVPKAKDFIADIREFLELYSLNPRAKNPVGTVSGGEIKPMTAAEADEPWYIQSVEQPQSFFDDLYGVSVPEAVPHDKSTSPASQSPEVNVSHFDEIPSSIPTTGALCLSHSSSHTRPARAIIINFGRLSGQSTTHQFSLSDPVRAMYEWLESRGDETGMRTEGEGEVRRLRLSFEGGDLSGALDERIADIPGLIDNNGGEGVNVDVSINEEGVSGGEKSWKDVVLG